MTEPESTEPQPSKEVTGGKSVEFSAAMSETKEPRNSGYGRRRSSRGSFLNRMGMSFRR